MEIKGLGHHIWTIPESQLTDYYRVRVCDAPELRLVRSSSLLPLPLLPLYLYLSLQPRATMDLS